jgi:hypothetical protein
MEDRLRTLLEDLRHELATLHGLEVCDGAAPSEHFPLDTLRLLGRVDDVLGAPEAPEVLAGALQRYLSERSPLAVRRQLRRSEILVNGVVREDVVCCDTELGFAICLVADPEKKVKPGAVRWKRDPNGYKGHAATEVVWGDVLIRPKAVDREELP